MKKFVYSIIAGLGLFLFAENQYSVMAQEETAGVPQETQTENPEAQPADPASVGSSVLQLEEAASQKEQAVRQGITIKKFRRQLPKYYRTLNLTEEQINTIYSLQQNYYPVLAFLRARIERLEQERNQKILDVLTEEQKQKLQQKTEEAEKLRNAESSSKQNQTPKKADADSENRSDNPR